MKEKLGCGGIFSNLGLNERVCPRDEKKDTNLYSAKSPSTSCLSPKILLKKAVFVYRRKIYKYKSIMFNLTLKIQKYDKRIFKSAFMQI